MRDRLYRSRDDRILFGVAGGVAEWLDLDPSLVRIVWALLVFAGGVGFLLYVVMAFVIPEEPEGYVPSYAAPYAGAASPAAATTASGAGATDAPTAPVVDPATGQPAPPAPGTVPPMSSWEAARAQRHAEREARRATRRAGRHADDGRGAIIFGVILVVAGLWFLARDYFPFLRFDLFGPALLIVVGIVVVAMAVRRGEEPR